MARVVRVVALGLLTGAELGVTGLVTAGLAGVDLATGGRVAVDLLAAAFDVTCLVVTGRVTARVVAGLAAFDCCPALAWRTLAESLSLIFVMFGSPR